MINWIIMIFFQLYSLGYLNFEQIFTTNLLMLLICRGLYIVAYYFNYYKDVNNELEEGKKLFTKNEIVNFTLKQVSLILIGIIFNPVTVFIAFYSLLMTTNYLKQISKNIRVKYVDKIAQLFNILIPLGGIIWFSFIEVNYYSIAAIGISLIAYFHYGLKISSLSLSKLIDKYDKRLLNRFPRAVKAAGMFLLIAIPSTIFSLSVVYAPATKTTYMVEMRDGVKLATDVYFAPGSFGTPKPVVMVRTPYGKSGWAADLALQYYTTQEYHAVVQDLRGTHDSEGGNQFLLFKDSYIDGVDTINWILDQSWCNGKIASAGPSALCINQYFYAGMAPDGLVAQQLWFGTPELIESVETVGRIFGNLFVTSNCTDTDFTVKLTDVYPDGRSMLITDGSLTVRSRNNYTSEAFMSGNQTDVYELFVDLWSTAYVFAPGHKIRIAISSSNYPRFAVNPNTGAPLAYNYLNYNIANNTLLVGPGYPSCIILPRLVNMSSTHTSF